MDAGLGNLATASDAFSKRMAESSRRVDLNVRTTPKPTTQVFRACLARFKLVPVEEDGRKRKKRRMEGEREKEKRQEEEKGGSRQGGEARKGTLLTGLMITSKTLQNRPKRSRPTASKTP